MTDRPILYSAPMVRACRADLKTETRRTRGLKRINQAPDKYQCFGLLSNDRRSSDFGLWAFGGEGVQNVVLKSPYGVRGDGLWHREAWRSQGCYDEIAPRDIPTDSAIWYEADGRAPLGFGKLRPGMFMCHWMSRDSSVVVASYPERLRSITPRDCLAEGIELGTIVQDFNDYLTPAYFKLWDSINGPGSAAKNEWVWVTKFSMVA